MRFVPLTALAAALALVVAGFSSADAQPRKKQQGDWVRLHVTVNKPRSFLDAGTAVKPGTMYYHNYVNLLQSRYPSYGPAQDNRDFRWPLPGHYDWAPY